MAHQRLSTRDDFDDLEDAPKGNKHFGGFEEDNDDGKSVRYVGAGDYYSDYITQTYGSLQSGPLSMFKWLWIVAGPALILFFYVAISNSLSTIIAFAALVVALQFIGFSILMLGWILEKDIGPRSM